MAIDRSLDDQTTDELRKTFAAILRDAAQMPGAQAFQAADAVLSGMRSILAGQRLSVPAEKQIDRDAIAADWHAGCTVTQIVKRHGCSRSTAYAYHPQKRNGATKSAPAGRTGDEATS